MFDYVKSIQMDLDQEPYVIPAGTNDVTANKTPDEVYSEILRLTKELTKQLNIK